MNVHIYVHMYKYMFISNLELLYLFKNHYTIDYMVRDFFQLSCLYTVLAKSKSCLGN